MARAWQLAIMAVCLLNGPATWSAPVILVADGQAKAVIIASERVMAPIAGKLPAQEPEKEAEIQRRQLQAAVLDLAATLEKVSGAKLAIVAGRVSTSDPHAVLLAGGEQGAPDTSRPAQVTILIGELAQAAVGPSGKTFPYKQGFRVVVSSAGAGTVSLLGESDLATSYAIYEILDRLGCRWYMPGDLGEVLPRLATISLPEQDVSATPGTIYRGIWYADEAYRRRNRMGGLKLSAGHALEGYISKEDRVAHPDWVATVDGKPQPRRLKWGKPEVAEAIAKTLIERLTTHPEPSISLSPDDGLGFDNSPEEQAFDAGDLDPGFGENSITDRYMILTNRIAAQVTQKFPGELFGMLAYANYTRPPVREPVHPAVIPQIAPITYSRAHPMNDDRVPDNQALRCIVEGWAKKCPMTSYYFYGWFLACGSEPNPMLAKWSHDVPYVLKHGNCQFWQPETTANFETSMHALYLGCRLAWNPNLDAAAVIRELNEGFYGHAAPAMTAYWEYIDQIWVGVDEYSGCGFGHLRRFTPEKMARARDLLNAGLAAAQTDIERERVKLADESFKLHEAFMKLRHDQAEGRWTTLAADAEAWRKRLLELAAQYKANYTFTGVSWSKNTMAGGYFMQFYEKTYKDATRVATDYELLTPQPLCQWRFKDDPEKTGEAAGMAKPEYDDSAWRSTKVTVETWSTLGFHSYFKSMWYRQNYTLPAIPDGKKVYLWIGGTDGSAKVFINGQHIPFIAQKTLPDKTITREPRDEANGYCQPFSFDITPALKPGGGPVQIAILCTRTFFNELGTGGLLAPVAIYRDK